MYDMPFENEYHIDKNFFLNPKIFGDISLYQIGRLYCKNNTTVPRHTHLDFFELTIVTEGRGAIITNDVSVPVKSGDIYVSFAGDFHEIVSDNEEPLRYDFVAMKNKNEKMHSDLDEIVARFHDAKNRIIHSENISALIANAIAELNTESEYTEVVLESIFMQVFAYIIREFKTASPIKYSKNVGDAEILCYQIMHYIDNHIYTMKSLSELAEITNYNYNYLSNLYKKVTSDTLTNYFRNRRLETARLLLAEKTLSVTKISAILNYSSVYIFSRAFKKRYGVSPTQISR